MSLSDPAFVTALCPAAVLLVGRRGGISDVIRAVTHSRFSHVAMVDQSQSGAWLVIEATTDVRGVAARKIEVITDDPTVEHLSVRIAYPPLTPRGQADVARAMWLETGQPYSQKVNLEILLGITVDASDGVNCAAAVNNAYAASNLPLIEAGVPTPELVAQSARLVEVWAR